MNKLICLSLFTLLASIFNSAHALPYKCIVTISDLEDNLLENDPEIYPTKCSQDHCYYVSEKYQLFISTSKNSITVASFYDPRNNKIDMSVNKNIANPQLTNGTFNNFNLIFVFQDHKTLKLNEGILDIVNCK